MVLNSNTLVRMCYVKQSSPLLVKCTCQLSYWCLDWFGKREDHWVLNLTNCVPRKDESCWDVALFHNFWRWKLTANRAHWVDALLFCPQRPKWSWFLPLILEGRLQYSTMRNSFTGEKQRGLLCLPAVDYQSSCIWLLPLVLSLHAIMWLYVDGSISKETTLEHSDSDICLTLERIRSCCGKGKNELWSLSCLMVGYKLYRKSCSSAFFGRRWTSSDQGTTKSFI